MLSIYSVYGQQSSDICADNTEPGYYRTPLGWSTHMSHEFTLEYQKGSDNVAADALSQVPVRHDKDTV